MLCINAVCCVAGWIWTLSTTTWNFCLDPGVSNLKPNVKKNTLVYISWLENYWELRATCNWKADDIRVHKLKDLQHSSEKLLTLSGLVQLEKYCIKISPVRKDKFKAKDVLRSAPYDNMSGKPFLWEQPKHFRLFILNKAELTWFLSIHLSGLLRVGQKY